MDFSFPISKALDIQDGFAIINSATLDSNITGSGSPSKLGGASSSQLRPTKENLGEILDTMGKLSCKAQGMKHPITSYSKFMTSQANRVYIKADQYKVYGFLRVETKKLSYKDPKDGLKEAKFVCVIDFYVHESVQRGGIGKAIFEKMLKTEQLQPNKLAYKRPSLELLSFLKKYYGLTDPVTQPNSYIIFSSFWAATPSQLLSPELAPRRNSNQSNNATDISKDTIEEQKESYRMPAFDLNVVPKIEKETTKKTALIDLLLKAPSILENNIFDQIKEKSPEPRDVTLFENGGARRFYNEVYKWHWNLEKEIAEEAKVLKRKQFLKTSSDEDNFDY